jgi:hypothetical protein
MMMAFGFGQLYHMAFDGFYLFVVFKLVASISLTSVWKRRNKDMHI